MESGNKVVVVINENGEGREFTLRVTNTTPLTLSSKAKIKAGAYVGQPQVEIAFREVVAKKLTRQAKWVSACAKIREGYDDLAGLVEEFQSWYDNLPEQLQASPVGEKLQAITEMDMDSIGSAIEEAEGVDLPRGFGRD